MALGPWGVRWNGAGSGELWRWVSSDCVIFFVLGIWVWGVKRWEYREETKIQKSWSGGPLNVFNFITEVPLETPVCCLKSTLSTFQKMLFKHGFCSNNFQTTLFWKQWPNTFLKILDTSVQCLNIEHYVLKMVTKHALNLLGNPSLEIGFDKHFEKFFVKHFFREF